MAYTTINKGTAYFNTKLYSGTGSSNAITGVGFQPDWIWIKRRSATNSSHIVDSVRGYNKAVASDLNNAQFTSELSSIDSDGFTVTGNPASANDSSSTYVAWNWLAGGTASSNTDGSITSSVSANTTAGFSIVKHNGTGAAATIGHGLGAVPKMIISKNMADAAAWVVYHESIGNDYYLSLNGTGTRSDNTMWNDTTPTSSVFSVGTHNNNNDSGDDIIHYVFTEKKGFSKFGEYTGNGSTNGVFIYTGFKPAFVMIKEYSGQAAHWMMYDNKREGYNVDNDHLKASGTDAEGTSDDMDLLSNGFKMRTSGSGENGNNDKFIYMAFAEAPIVGSNNVPATAR